MQRKKNDLFSCNFCHNIVLTKQKDDFEKIIKGLNIAKNGKDTILKRFERPNELVRRVPCSKGTGYKD